MAWALLVATIILEVAGTTLMKLSQGMTLFWPSLGVVVCYAGAVAGLTLALRELELSVAYAIWAGAETVLTAAIGMAVFHEPVTAVKLTCVALVVVGVAGLHLA